MAPGNQLRNGVSALDHTIPVRSVPGRAQVLQNDGELSITTQLPNGETDTRDKYKRVCVKCELALRKQDWGLMSEEEKAQNPKLHRGD